MINQYLIESLYSNSGLPPIFTLPRPAISYAYIVDITTYTSQRQHKNKHDKSLPVDDPPSSPPSMNLLAIRVIKQVQAQMINTTTLKPRVPAGT